ncbi:hypothetical protein ABT317_27760, partial [Streptomyces carpinensis]
KGLHSYQDIVAKKAKFATGTPHPQRRAPHALQHLTVGDQSRPGRWGSRARRGSAGSPRSSTARNRSPPTRSW